MRTGRSWAAFAAFATIAATGATFATAVPDAHAGPEATATEEVVVWGDRLLRWERRWYVQTEVGYPLGVALFADKNREASLSAIQIRAVLSCDRDFPMGPLLEEVSCAIEDVGLVGLSRAATADGDAVLDELDATLTGAKVQMQVTPAGAVPYVDLEGVAAHDKRTRDRLEQLRQLVSRLMLPFHLKLPDVVRDGAQWQETASRLMSMPSETGSGGGSVVTHRMDLVGDRFIVQSIGEGTIAPTVGREALVDSGVQGMPDVRGLPVDIYELHLTGVAVIDRPTGIMSERVWAVYGGLTASSPHAPGDNPFHHLGRYRVLDDVERPDVGQTYLAGLDGKGGLPAWVALEP